MYVGRVRFLCLDTPVIVWEGPLGRVWIHVKKGVERRVIIPLFVYMFPLTDYVSNVRKVACSRHAKHCSVFQNVLHLLLKQANFDNTTILTIQATFQANLRWLSVGLGCLLYSPFLLLFDSKPRQFHYNEMTMYMLSVSPPPSDVELSTFRKHSSY